jgi:hypothetical protein
LPPCPCPIPSLLHTYVGGLGFTVKDGGDQPL